MSPTLTDLQGVVVGIDASGNSLYHDVQTHANRRMEEIFARI